MKHDRPIPRFHGTFPDGAATPAITLAPARRDNGFHDSAYWIWCGSVVWCAEDGNHHMFASRWPRGLAFSPNWCFNSEVVRAVSPTPEGPYRFQDAVLPPRDPACFDGRCTHNPLIRFFNGTYYLYYMGTTYPEPPPVPGEAIPRERYLAAWNRKRIGLATSRSVFGPWTRSPEPLLLPRPDRWDATITTNPAVAILAGGVTYMVYKSRAHADAPLQLGVAVAPSPNGPFTRLGDTPLFADRPDLHLEDPFLWHDGASFHLLLKDNFKGTAGGITGEWGAGVHLLSDDCVRWRLADPAKAYSRRIVWEDGSESSLAHLERPFLLQDAGGTPTHLFAAAAEGPRPWAMERTWNLCIPLRGRLEKPPHHAAVSAQT